MVPNYTLNATDLKNKKKKACLQARNKFAFHLEILVHLVMV